MWLSLKRGPFQPAGGVSALSRKAAAAGPVPGGAWPWLDALSTASKDTNRTKTHKHFLPAVTIPSSLVSIQACKYIKIPIH
ncbi:exported hypothetical protein [Candidatus Sulfopaludibacter sp. SbA3]|nr:exported hypothetical protein [Candidatus Sulfopaludibacter sp. SbA3]